MFDFEVIPMANYNRKKEEEEREQEARVGRQKKALVEEFIDVQRRDRINDESGGGYLKEAGFDTGKQAIELKDILNDLQTDNYSKKREVIALERLLHIAKLKNSASEVTKQ